MCDGTGDEKRWCILRMGAGATLRLVRSLVDNGFEAWTPVVIEYTHARRGYERESIERALMPSFAFVTVDRFADLIDLMNTDTQLYRVWDPEAGKMVTCGFAKFTIFHGENGYALVSDRQLDPLRAAAASHKFERKPDVFFEGDRVKMSDGGFAGLYGTVLHQFGKYVTVRFDEWNVPVKILAEVLQRDIDGESGFHVNGAQPERPSSAKAVR